MRLRDWTDYVLVAVIVALAGSVLWEAPSAFRSAVDEAQARSRLGASERELVPAIHAEVDGRALLAATHVIPASATYFVDATPADAEAARPITFYFLFPRRYVDDPTNADWVLFFGARPPHLSVRVGKLVRLGPSLVASRVQR